MRPAGTEERTEQAVLLSVACLGLSAFVTQVLTLREFLNVFSGNELILGLILGNWLLLTGLGGFLGRYGRRIHDKIRWVVVAQIAIAGLPAAQTFGIRMLKRLLLTGVILGIGEAFWSSLVLLAPFCLLSGFLLALFSGLASRQRGARQIGDVYVLDTLGGIAGGLLFSLCLASFLPSFEIATFLLILNLLAALHLAAIQRRWGLAGSAAVAMAIALAVFSLTDLERRSSQAMFPGFEVTYQKSTPYGNLVVARRGKQTSVYENGVPLGSAEDPAAAEEIVHYALAQYPEARRVLLVSGGLVGALREIEKYPVTRIDYVELDPVVLDLAREIAGAGTDSRVHRIAADARRYVRSQRHQYDAILMALPDPFSAQLNRFYTAEFFAAARSAMRPDGVLSFSLSGAENYANPQVRLLAAAVYRALSSAFRNVLLIPGGRQYFVASDRPLGYDIAARLERHGIKSRYVRAEYLAAKLTPDRRAAARRMVATRTDANRDFHPVSYYAHLQYWLSQFGSTMLLPALMLSALLIPIGALLASAPRRAVPAALSASGFTGMGLEVVLLICFQVSYGYLYQQLGLIIAGFMAGAAAGAAWSGSSAADPAKLMFRLDALLAAAAFLLVPLLGVMTAAASPPALSFLLPVVFPIANGVVGFLVGAQFPPAAKLLLRGVEETAGDLYAFDLLGACLGAFAVTTFCIPLAGIAGTCVLLGGIKLLSAAGLRLRQHALSAPPVLPATAPVGSFLAFGFALFVFVAIGMLIVPEETSGAIYAFSFAPMYYWLLVVLLGIGILRAMNIKALAAAALVTAAGARRSARRLFASTKVSLSRWTYFLAFSLAVFYPIFRCYFKIPYLFCHACPRKCVFGFARPFLVPAALVMNLEQRFWCYHACPIGTLLDCQARAFRGSKRVPHGIRAVAIGALAFTAISYFKVRWDLKHQPAVEFDWYTFFFHNAFIASGTVIATALVLLFLAFRWRRSFCDSLCPVGTFSDLLLRWERSIGEAGTAPRSVSEHAPLAATESRQ